jgi:ABC-type polysaccharide/polyol phosphate transport system ATPase subunit
VAKEILEKFVQFVAKRNMTDIAIRVENLSKRYRIGALQKRANTLRETLGNLAAFPFDYLRRTLRGPTGEEIIWALKDISFEACPEPAEGSSVVRW